MIGPETVELQFAPQHAGEPAGAPLTRPAKPHLGEPQQDYIVAFGRLAVILREQRKRARAADVWVEHFDGLAPSLGLGGIDLAEIEHVTLDHATAIEALVLGDAPIEMRLAVLSPFGSSQKHSGKDFATSRRFCESRSSLVGLHY